MAGSSTMVGSSTVAGDHFFYLNIFLLYLYTFWFITLTKMSAVATKLFNKYELSPDTDIVLLKKYAIELTPLLPDKNSRKLARRRFLQLGLTKLVPDHRRGQIDLDNLFVTDVTARQLAELVVHHECWLLSSLP